MASAPKKGPSATEAPGPSRFGASKGTVWANNPQRAPFPSVFHLATRFCPDTLSQDIPGFPKSLGCRLTFKLRTPSVGPLGRGFSLVLPFQIGRHRAGRKPKPEFSRHIEAAGR